MLCGSPSACGFCSHLKSCQLVASLLAPPHLCLLRGRCCDERSDEWKVVSYAGRQYNTFAVASLRRSASPDHENSDPANAPQDNMLGEEIDNVSKVVVTEEEKGDGGHEGRKGER